MMIKYRWLATLIIGFWWTLISIIVADRVTYMDMGSSGMFMTGLFAFGIASVITYAVLGAYEGGKSQAQPTRRTRVEKLLRELNDSDLDMLRERLMYDESDPADGEYESLEALLTKQKRQ